MASKTFLFLALAFAVVLLITSQVAAAREVAPNNESEIDAEYGGHHKVDGRGGYNNKPTADDDDGGSAGDNNPDIRARCRYRCCRYSYRGWCIRCCGTYAEAVAFEQARN